MEAAKRIPLLLKAAWFETHILQCMHSTHVWFCSYDCLLVQVGLGGGWCESEEMWKGLKRLFHAYCELFARIICICVCLWNWWGLLLNQAKFHCACTPRGDPGAVVLVEAPKATCHVPIFHYISTRQGLASKCLKLWEHQQRSNISTGFLTFLIFLAAFLPKTDSKLSVLSLQSSLCWARSHLRCTSSAFNYDIWHSHRSSPEFNTWSTRVIRDH